MEERRKQLNTKRKFLERGIHVLGWSMHEKCYAVMKNKTHLHGWEISA